MDKSPSKPVLPRFTELPAFDPHIANFTCKYEAAVNPPVTPQAEALFQQAMAKDDWRVWPQERDYAGMAALLKQAMDLGHWKAQFNLAGLYFEGQGVPRDVNEALRLTEDLMQKGVPAAWDNMGTYYMGGAGPLKASSTVAYAFWQRAAEMGSMSAQAYLGNKLHAGHDEPPTFWGNWEVGAKMLECAVAQGSGDAAYQLGSSLDVNARSLDSNAARVQYRRALEILQEGVKFGHEGCANYLFASFDDGDALVGHTKDPSRARRYKTLADRLFHDSYLKLPNLDKVLPLPPAQLPKWNSDPDTLIDAAKAVLPAPKPAPAHPNTSLAGPEHIPPGFTLPTASVSFLRGHLQRADRAGFWQPQVALEGDGLTTAQYNAALALNATPARYYAAGDMLDSFRALHYDPHSPSRAAWASLSGSQLRGMLWHHLGQPVPVVERAPHRLVQRGIAVAATFPPERVCNGLQPCPRTGVWYARPAASAANQASASNTNRTAQDEGTAALVQVYLQQFKHPLLQQAYVEQGQAFPSPQARHLPLDAGQIAWEWLGQANPVDASGYAVVAVPQIVQSVQVANG
ncbi:hypothetical protein os1_21810 [Comamonadaceae bacterium OS-1]|nr:hypothetical protein os1_21810 [Comamonadaceae bacterium OS-1]